MDSRRRKRLSSWSCLQRIAPRCPLPSGDVQGAIHQDCRVERTTRSFLRQRIGNAGANGAPVTLVEKTDRLYRNLKDYAMLDVKEWGLAGLSVQPLRCLGRFLGLVCRFRFGFAFRFANGEAALPARIQPCSRISRQLMILSGQESSNSRLLPRSLAPSLPSIGFRRFAAALTAVGATAAERVDRGRRAAACRAER